MNTSCLLLLLVCMTAQSAQAGTASSGTVYIGAAFGTHNLYKVDYDYDGVGSMTATTSVLATLPTAADAMIVPGGDIIVAGQGPNVYRVNPTTGAFTTVSAGNNGNTLSLDPSGTSVWIGWMDTSPSQVPLAPFSNGTPHSVSGADSTITSLAFTAVNGVYYANGGDGGGNFGRIDLGTFTTTRLIPALADSVHYDAFSRSLILVTNGHAVQLDAAASTSLGGRNDSNAGENYLMLRPDGRGHLFGTRWGGSGGNPNAGRLILIDYSETGSLSTAIIASAPIVDGLSGGVAVDTSILADGFEGRL
jgi:hypothetical protein